jgi:hypothetical protein
MSYYRLYFMNSYSGHIERFEDFDSDSDAEALALAKTKEGPLALELWCARRKVMHLEALDLASQLLAQRRIRKDVKAQVEPEPDSDQAASENRSA